MAGVVGDVDKQKQLRCTSCGKMSRVSNFVDGAAGKHLLEAATSVSASRPGKKGGFVWEERDLEPADLKLLERATSAALKRLRKAVGRPDDDEATPQDQAPVVPETVEARRAYVAEAEDLVRAAQDELAFRLAEVAKS